MVVGSDIKNNIETFPELESNITAQIQIGERNYLAN